MRPSSMRQVVGADNRSQSMAIVVDADKTGFIMLVSSERPGSFLVACVATTSIEAK